MTESTNPTPAQSQAEKIKADLSAMLLKAAQAGAKAASPASSASDTAPKPQSPPAAQ
ncbi:MAG: hypothetical protein K2Y10_07500 [Burkholderiaceae bacterium]|nr:hypothetical protein [Burkholderiaceae bacterium]